VWQGTWGKNGKGQYASPYIYNGLDRIDNEKGYLLDNVTPCCKICNQAKHALSLDDFLAWCQRLINFQKGKV